MLPSFKLLPFELHFPFASSACVRDEKVSQHHPAWSSCNTHTSLLLQLVSMSKQILDYSTCSKWIQHYTSTFILYLKRRTELIWNSKIILCHSSFWPFSPFTISLLIYREYFPYSTAQKHTVSAFTVKICNSVKEKNIRTVYYLLRSAV